jgi:DNA-binding CsgD family transcriptional regulator
VVDLEHNATETAMCIGKTRWRLLDDFESDGKRYMVAMHKERCAPLGRRKRPPTLSERERQVLRCAADGRSNKEIAYELGLAHATVRVLLHRAATKLGVTRRSDIIARFATAFT